MNAFSSIRLSRRAGLVAVWITIMLLVSLLPQAAQAQPRSEAVGSAASSRCQGDGVYLYEHANYKGRCRMWTASDKDFGDDNFNDMASSIHFVGSYGGGKYVAILYEHAGRGGARTVFAVDDPNLGDDAIGHDRASSIRIDKVPQCTGDGVYLYENKNFGGRCRKFVGSPDDLTYTGFNDTASSLKLAGTYGGGRRTVTLCENAGYGGRCTTFTSDDPNLGNDEVGHDRASSLRVQYTFHWPVAKPDGAGFGVYGATFLQWTDLGRGLAQYNPGIDVMRDPGRPAKGQPVYAAYRGRVAAIVPGVSIVIVHTIDQRKVWTQYTNVDHHQVKVGESVKKGQQIGAINPAGYLRFSIAYEQPSGEAVGQDCKWVQAHYENPFLWLGTAGGKAEAASCP